LLPSRLLFGYGPDTFPFVFEVRYPRELFRTGLAEPGMWVDDPHNILLDALFSTGLLGLSALLWILLWFFRTTLKALNRWTDTPKQSLAAAVLASMVAYLIQAQLNPSVITVEVLFWCLIGFVPVLLDQSERSFRN
jgi:O-antigen ligase